MTLVLESAATLLASAGLAARLLFDAVARRRWPQGLWAVGLVFVALAAACETVAVLGHWTPALYRTWYLSGAVLAAAWLGQGTVHLHAPRRIARVSLLLLAVASVVAAVVVARAPVALPPPWLTLPSGAGMPDTVRHLTPWFNIAGTVALLGGAIRSLWRFGWNGGNAHRAAGTAAIAAGALLAAAGGAAGRGGDVAVLHAAVLAGVLAIGAGVLLSATVVPALPPPDCVALRRRRMRVVRWSVGSAASLLLGMVLVLPILPWPMQILGDVRPSYTPRVPLENRGVYLATPRGALQLYSWFVQPDSVPADAPWLDASAIRAVVTVQKAFDEPANYRLYYLATGQRLAWRTVSRTRRALRLLPPFPLSAGAYLLVVPSDGMFGGHTLHYFRVRGATVSSAVPSTATDGL